MAGETIDSVFRDFNTQGNPLSGDYEPEKPRIRALLRRIQNASGLAITKNTLAALNGVTPPTENYMGIVLDDPDPANNGYYSRVLNAWVWERGFRQTFAEFINLGGTANAQTGDLENGVDLSEARIFIVEVEAENTGPMTFNGIDVVNAAGNPLSAGEWTSTVLFRPNSDGDYQLLIDAGAAAAAAQSATDAAAQKGYAEEWAQSDDPISVAAGGDGSTDRSSKHWAEQSLADADRAEGYAAMLSVDKIKFATVALLQADTVMSYMAGPGLIEVGAGDIIEAQGFRYEVADSGASDEDVTTAGGVKLYVLPTDDGSYAALAFGVRMDDSTDNAAVINAAIVKINGGELVFPEGSFRSSNIGKMSHAGTKLRGASKWKTKWKPHASLSDGDAIIDNEGAAIGSSGHNCIEGFCFDLDDRSVTAIDLSSINKTVVNRCHFEGGPNLAGAVGVGVKFGAPLLAGAYTNNVQDCSFLYLAKGIEYGEGANMNVVSFGEVIGCTVGIDAAPGGAGVGQPRVFGTRVEGNATGIIEGALYAFYDGIRFEQNTVDMEFTAVSDHVYVGPASTGASGAIFLNFDLAQNPRVDADDLGFYDAEDSLGRIAQFRRKKAHLNPGAAWLASAPGGAWTDYFAGTTIWANQNWINWRNGADSANVAALRLSSGNNLEYGASLLPGTDSAYTLGSASRRPISVYAVNGTINTSDEREKEQILEIDEAERRVAVACKGLIRKFKRRDEVDRDGAVAVWHVGVIAQQIVAAFEAEGLNALSYGIVSHEFWDAEPEEHDDEGNLMKEAVEAGDRFGVNYNELLAFVIAAM